MRLLVILSLFFAFSCNAFVQRYLILEKKVSAENYKRVVIYSDYHGIDDASENLIALDKRQSDLITKELSQNIAGGSALLVEEPNQKELHSRMAVSWGKARSNVSGHTPLQLLSILGNLSGNISVKCVDRRHPLKDILSLTRSFTDSAKKTNLAVNSLRKEFLTFDLSVDTVLSLLNSAFSDTYSEFQTIRSLVKSDDNKELFEGLIADLIPVKESVERICLQLSKYKDMRWFELVNKKPKLIKKLFNEAVLPYFFAPELYPISTWMMDSSSLTFLMNENCPAHVHIAVGGLHGQLIQDVLEEEGYDVLYDSYIETQDGYMYTDMHRAFYAVSVEAPRPVSDKVFGYSNLDQTQLEELFEEVDEQLYKDEL